VELNTFVSRWGERYAIVHSARSGAYLRFTGDEVEIAERLDGASTLGTLSAEAIDRGTSPDDVVEVVAALRDGGALDHPAIDLYAVIGERIRSRGERYRARVIGGLRSQTITVPGVNRFLDWLYPRGGRLLFTPPFVVATVVAALAGLASFGALVVERRYSVSFRLSSAEAVALLALGVIVLFIHELGHALAVRHAGRRVVNAGFRLYLGHPAFFIDSTDLLFATPRQRAVNAAAGPYAESVATAFVSVAALLLPRGELAALLFRVSALAYLNVLINLIPFIELDGYWLLTDLLDVPRLRARSIAVVRYELPARLRRQRGRLTVSERGMVLFAVFGAAFTVGALILAALLWIPIGRRIVEALWGAGLTGRVVLACLAAVVAGPLVDAGVRAGGRVARRGGRLLDDLRFRAQTRWRVEAVELLESAPIIGALADDDLNELAGRVSRRRCAPFSAVVRQGQAADAFFVIRRGVFEVTVDAGATGGERVVRRLARGDVFGEIGLVERRPRTATVRAVTAGEVFVIDAGTFDRVLSRAMSPADMAPSVAPLLQLSALAPFRHLSEQQLSAVAARTTWLWPGAGETIVQEGDVPDGFYVILAGKLEVLIGEKHVATLGAGNHFGDVALVQGGRRTATVRTMTPARLIRVDRAAFTDVVARALASLPDVGGERRDVLDRTVTAAH
jgi:putative peptide zinc metalloprotease protein